MDRLQKIQKLKEDLFNTDYKVSKCAECFMLGIELPYSLADLVEERNSMRSEINTLEALSDESYYEIYPDEIDDFPDGVDLEEDGIDSYETN